MNPDFRDLLSAFSAARVEYLLVGAYAMAVHGLPRATGDMDVWVRRTPDNAKRVLEALAAFGAPVGALSPSDFEAEDAVFQIGVAPCRIDVLTAIDGVEFAAAWEARVRTILEGLEVPVIAPAQLLLNKRALGRPKDMGDVAFLDDLLKGE